MKRYMTSILLVLTLLLAGCNGEGENVVGESTTELTVSAVNPEEHPQTQALIDYMETVNEETKGTLEFDLFPASQLGDYETVYEEVMQGTIDMALLSLPSARDSNIEILSLPYLVNNYEEGEILYQSDGYLYGMLQDILHEHGVEILGFRALGFGGIGTTKEINDHSTPGTDKEIVARIPQMDIVREYALSMGFKTNSIPFSEVFSSLQTGTVEGSIGSGPASNYQNFRDVLTHYYQYNNFFEASGLIINKDLFENLSESEQDILLELGNEFTLEGIEEAEKIDREQLDLLKEEGIEVIEYTQEEIEEFSDYVRENVWPLNEVIDEEHIENIIKEIE